MSDTVILAIIAGLVQLAAIFWTRRGTKEQVAEVHDLVNSKHDVALSRIDSLAGANELLVTEIRDLRAALAKVPDAPEVPVPEATLQPAADVPPPPAE